MLPEPEPEGADAEGAAEPSGEETIRIYEVHRTAEVAPDRGGGGRASASVFAVGLKESGIRYVFLGDELGARREEGEYY